MWYIWSWSRWLSCVLFIYCSRIVCPLSCFQRWWTMSLIAKTWRVWQRQPLLGSGTCGKRYSTPHCVHPLNLEHLLFYHLTWGVGGQGEKSIGRFSEAGLHEWMPYIIIRARSRKRSQLPLPGRILIRCSVGLHCVTIEVKPRILKQCKCHNCCICKNYRGKVMEDGEKSVCIVSWLTRRPWARGKNAFFGILQHKLPDTFRLWAFKNAFKVGAVTSWIHCHHLHARSKNSQGT